MAKKYELIIEKSLFIALKIFEDLSKDYSDIKIEKNVVLNNDYYFIRYR